MKGILAFFLIVLLIFCISNFGLVYKRSQKHTEKHIEVDMTNSDTATVDKADNDDHPVMDETPTTTVDCESISRVEIHNEALKRNEQDSYEEDIKNIPGLTQNEFLAKKTVSKTNSVMKDLSEWNKKYYHSLQQKNIEK